MLLINVDNMFANCLPVQIKDNAKEVNDSGMLRMPKDYNTNRKLIKRLFQEDQRIFCASWFNTLMNLVINFWYFILQEL